MKNPKTMKEAVNDGIISEVACMGCGSETRKLYTINEGMYANYILCRGCMQRYHWEVFE
tara:strand:- start:118 stop:294 length:177 start_codon:yes stop_codon:yes gene_type:complete